MPHIAILLSLAAVQCHGQQVECSEQGPNRFKASQSSMLLKLPAAFTLQALDIANVFHQVAIKPRNGSVLHVMDSP